MSDDIRVPEFPEKTDIFEDDYLHIHDSVSGYDKKVKHKTLSDNILNSTSFDAVFNSLNTGAIAIKLKYFSGSGSNPLVIAHGVDVTKIIGVAFLYYDTTISKWRYATISRDATNLYISIGASGPYDYNGIVVYTL